MASPAWVAVIVTTPSAPLRMTVRPERKAGPEMVKATVNPGAVVVADIPKGGEFGR